MLDMLLENIDICQPIRHIHPITEEHLIINIVSHL